MFQEERDVRAFVENRVAAFPVGTRKYFSSDACIVFKTHHIQIELRKNK